MAQSAWRGDQAKAIVARFAAMGLNDAADYLKPIAQDLAPEDTGGLEQSATTHHTDEHELASQVQFTKYTSVWQHERLDYRHSKGQAKFLTHPLIEKARLLTLIVALQVKKGLR